MKRHAPIPIAASLLVAAWALPAGDGLAQTPGGAEDAKIASALTAGPASITAEAAVMDWPAGEGGAMTELRPGTNGWVCLPDVPSTPGDDPMCLDPVFQEWAAAWQGKTAPAIESVGLAYMLMGGTDASNIDPYATAPAEGEEWIEAGPHVMIVVPDPALLEGITTNPDSGGPFVMWQGTPYAHIMMPVGPAKEHDMHKMHRMDKEADKD
ncbi:MAG TPA: hypothetical protein VM737_12295 [Gemmatimonadota bacterium]|nr:hypothetical protein [Gemmatimonadota bacterium]